MYLTSLQIVIFFILFFHSFINCRDILKRELKNPETVLGDVYHIVGDKATNSYTVDYSNMYHVPLQDLRTANVKLDLNTHGFTYVSKWHVSGIERMQEFSDESYHALREDSVKLVKTLTGAKSAISFASTFRNHNALEAEKSIPMIHSDMSPDGAEFTKLLARDYFLKSDDPNDIEFGKHLEQGGKNVVIYNVWRPIRTVQDNPLGICKWDSALQEDALNWGIKPTEVGNAVQGWKYRKGQSWYYLSKQEPHEVYVFMQHDSRAHDGHGINVPHASFSLREDFGKRATRSSFESVIFAIVDPAPPEGIFLRWSKQIKSLWTD